MICYKDMTFCPFYKDCANPCFRSLTDEVWRTAKNWWKDDDPPICQYMSKPDCFKEKDDG